MTGKPLKPSVATDLPNEVRRIDFHPDADWEQRCEVVNIDLILDHFRGLENQRVDLQQRDLGAHIYADMKKGDALDAPPLPALVVEVCLFVPGFPHDPGPYVHHLGTDSRQRIVGSEGQGGFDNFWYCGTDNDDDRNQVVTSDEQGLVQGEIGKYLTRGRDRYVTSLTFIHDPFELLLALLASASSSWCREVAEVKEVQSKDNTHEYS